MNRAFVCGEMPPVGTFQVHIFLSERDDGLQILTIEASILEASVLGKLPRSLKD